MIGADIGIDLGTATVIVHIRGRGIVLHEPSVVAIEQKSNTILAVGEEARKMLGRTPGNITAIRPLREGVISDYDITERMLKYFIQKSVGKPLFLKPRIAICVPSSVTEVERRAVEDAAKQAGARQVLIIEEPIAAAIGAGIDIGRAMGSMVVDIGGGTTDVAVISLGGVVVSNSIKVAGDNFDAALIRHMRKNHNLLIGERTAEEIKVNVASAYPRTVPVAMDVRGRNLVSGLPRTITVTSDEMLEALSEPVTSVVDTVIQVLERTPPELAADIFDRGIVMTGGGAMLHGLDKLISKKTGINAILAEEALTCVAKGTGKYIELEFMSGKPRSPKKRKKADLPDRDKKPKRGSRDIE